MGCGSRFWVGWAGVLGRSLVDWLSLGRRFFSLVCWLVEFFFFFKVALVDVGLCRWWLSVLLRQWILVTSSCVVDVIVVDDDNGENIIYYFNV